MMAARQQQTNKPTQSVSVNDKIYRKKADKEDGLEVGLGSRLQLFNRAAGKASLTGKQRMEEVRS